MSDIMILLIALVAGAALGVFFFWGLWLTVEKGVHSKRPGLLFGFSMIVRMLITLAGFIYISNGSLQRLAACLMGFFTIRWYIMRQIDPELPPEQENKR